MSLLYCICLSLLCILYSFVNLFFFWLQIFDYDGGRTLEELIKYVERHIAGEEIEDEADQMAEEEGEGGDMGEEETEEGGEEEEAPEDVPVEEDAQRDEL